MVSVHAATKGFCCSRQLIEPAAVWHASVCWLAMLVSSVNALDSLEPVNENVTFNWLIYSYLLLRRSLTYSMGPLASWRSLDWSTVNLTLFIHTFGAEFERSCWFSERGCLKSIFDCFSFKLQFGQVQFTFQNNPFPVHSHLIHCPRATIGSSCYPRAVDGTTMALCWSIVDEIDNCTACNRNQWTASDGNLRKMLRRRTSFGRTKNKTKHI